MVSWLGRRSAAESLTVRPKMREALSSGADPFDIEVAVLNAASQILLAAVAAARFVRLLVEEEFSQYVPALPANLIDELASLHGNPAHFAEASEPEVMRHLIEDWLDQFDDEPEGNDYWSYQGAVVVEYLLKLKASLEPSGNLLSMMRYCSDLAYFLDQELDRGDREHENAERAFWVSAAEILAKSSAKREELIELESLDELRIVQAARDVIRRLA